MSQRDMLQEFDAGMALSFLDAGLADSATYTEPGGDPVPDITVLVDRQSEMFGDDEMPVAGSRTIIAIQLSDIPDPKVNAQLAIGSENFVLVKRVFLDESMSAWTVRHG